MDRGWIGDGGIKKIGKGGTAKDEDFILRISKRDDHTPHPKFDLSAYCLRQGGRSSFNADAANGFRAHFTDAKAGKSSGGAMHTHILKGAKIRGNATTFLALGA